MTLSGASGIAFPILPPLMRQNEAPGLHFVEGSMEFQIVPRPSVDDAFQHLLLSHLMPAFSTGGLFVTPPFLFKIL